MRGAWCGSSGICTTTAATQTAHCRPLRSPAAPLMRQALVLKPAKRPATWPRTINLLDLSRHCLSTNRNLALWV